MTDQNPVLIFFVCAFVFLGSCSQPKTTLTASETQAMVGEVLSSFSTFEKGLGEGDLETVSKYYSEDPRFYWVENGRVAYSSGALAKETLSAFYPSLKGMTFTSLEKKVTPLRRNLAMLYVEYEQNLVFANDQELQLNGAMTILLEKRDAEWEFIIGHSSGKDENP